MLFPDIIVPISRRDFLRFTVGGGLLAASAYLFKETFRPSQLSHYEERTLEAFLDTLIPDDETPGALQLGVAEKIKAKASEDNKYRLLIKKGCMWLNTMAGKLNSESFVSLREEERNAVLASALKRDAGSLQRTFLQQIRSDAFHYYYGHRGSWAQLGYYGPPQPNGFPDYYRALSSLS